jgi:hypothetical protein
MDQVGHECLFGYRVNATFIHIAHVVTLEHPKIPNILKEAINK